MAVRADLAHIAEVERQIQEQKTSDPEFWRTLYVKLAEEEESHIELRWLYRTVKQLVWTKREEAKRAATAESDPDTPEA